MNGSDETKTGNSQPNPDDWAAINSVTNMPRLQVKARPMPQLRAPESTPEPLATIDLKPRKHRSYAGLYVLGVLALAGGGIWYVLTQTDLVGHKVRREIPFSAPTLQVAGQAPAVDGQPKPTVTTALRISSQPEGARVVINGLVVSGKTPVTASVPAQGALDIRLLLEGHAPKSISVKSPDAPVSVDLTPADVQKTNLEIVTEPSGALVVIDGVEFGQTPAKLTAVPAVGRTSIRLRLKGHRDHVVLTELAANSSKRIGVRLTPADQSGALSAVRLAVESNIPGTTINRLNHTGAPTFAGRAGQKALIMSADRGSSVHLQATAKGHLPQERRIHITSVDYTVQLAMVALDVGKGTLTLKGPTGLTVFLDSEELDSPTLTKTPLKAGQHTLVVIDAKSRGRIKTTITIPADGHLDLRVERKKDGLTLVELPKPSE